ncbi:MAG: helix-turn-helix transcriptional regulator [Thermomicrobiales bacterium]|nr:helix-turn-helix transcriptional regulator [Thermomicrobiales bacterium]
MPRFSRIQQEVASELRALVTSAMLPQPLAAQAMASLERAIGWDGYRLFGVDHRTLLINRLLAASDNDGWARKEWLQEVYLVDETLPYIQLPTILQSGLRGVAYQERQDESWGYPESMLERVSAEEHYRYFFESRSPVGGVLMAGFSARGRWLAALQTYRRDTGQAFTPGEVDFLRRMSSVVAEALHAAFLREHALERSPADPQASGVALLDSEGEITYASPVAREWIDLIGRDERNRAGLLPTPLWSAMLGLRRLEQGAGHSVVRTMTAAGPVTIEATVADNQGGTAIVINHLIPDRAPEIPADWRLTGQQQQVTRLVVEGKSNQQIAQALFVSENTVEWHLRQIFNRLDVRSRSQLAARFFQDVLIDRYQDPDLT